jgi:uncharacterized protein YllA (UPF0747 family)
VDGLKETLAVDAELEKAFVQGAKASRREPAAATAPAMQSRAIPARVPLSTRIRGDYSAALKRASLERQLAGVEPYTLTDILEQAIEPWLRTNGYLK